MAAGVVLDGEARGVDAAVFEHVAGGEVGRGEVVVAGGGEDAQGFVVFGALGQGAGDVDEAGEGAAAVGGALPFAVRFVVAGEVAFVEVDAELVAQVALEEGDVDRAGLGVEGVAVGVFAGVVELVLGVAAVEQADGFAFFAQELLGEADGVDAQVAAEDVLRGEAGIAVQLLGDALLLGAREFVSLEEGQEVVGAGEFLGFAEQRIAVFPLRRAACGGSTRWRRAREDGWRRRGRCRR